MELLHKGAEANLYLQEGALVKERVCKKYRLPELDTKLRRQRTRREAKNLQRAADFGIKVPKIISCDEKNYTLKMEYLSGRLLKDIFDTGQEIPQLSEEVGGLLRKLHEKNLVHNDLTTSNLIQTTSGVYIIDFGLAYHTTRLEDKAMDLVVFKKSIQATHTMYADQIWENLLAGYKPDSETIQRVQTILSRVRYK